MTKTALLWFEKFLTWKKRLFLLKILIQFSGSCKEWMSCHLFIKNRNHKDRGDPLSCIQLAAEITDFELEKLRELIDLTTPRQLILCFIYDLCPLGKTCRTDFLLQENNQDKEQQQQQQQQKYLKFKISYALRLIYNLKKYIFSSYGTIVNRGVFRTLANT